jgi:hypothetical protein
MPTTSTTAYKPSTVIVCLPPRDGDTTAHWLAATTAVAGHTDAPPTLTAIFPVRRRRLATGWGHRQLLGITGSNGHGAYAAGGHVKQLDLPRAAQAGWLEATCRWATWQQVTTGLKPAGPWHLYQRRHRQAPDRFALSDARRGFLNQPLVAAMLAHNAVPGAWQLDPFEVDAYQAGQRAYATCHMLAATCGQAMLTTAGTWLQPAGDTFADKLNYLRQAAAHLHHLPATATIVALTI